MAELEMRISPAEKALAYWRLLHPVPSLLTVAAAGALLALAYKGLPPMDRLLHALVVEAAMQFSISAFNDYFDREIDRGRVDKPVAMGIVSPGAALAVGAALGLLALALAVPLSGWVLVLTAIGLGGGLAYDAGLKYTAFSWLPFSIAFPTLPLWAWAVAYSDGRFPAQVWWVVPLVAVMVVGIHMADTIPDLSADVQAGVRGTAHRLGLAKSLALCWGAFGLTVLLTLLLMAFLPYKLEWYLPGLGLGLLLMGAGLGLYLTDHSRLKVMSLLFELGGLTLGIGWLAAITL